MASTAFSTPRNSIVLNGNNTNSSFASIRIDPNKKLPFSPSDSAAANTTTATSPALLQDDDDVYLRLMLTKVPQIGQHFDILDRLGEGTFSKVYSAQLRGSTERFALKYILPIVKPARIAKELRFLRELRNVPNVIGIKACLYSAGHTVLVMPIVDHNKFQDYFQLMDILEVREYMRNMLDALASVHGKGIIHRDIKPANFLYNRSARQYALVDFGLSQTQKELDQAMHYFDQERSAVVHAGSRSAPRLGGGVSRAKANLSIRFQKNTGAVIHHTSTLSQKGGNDRTPTGPTLAEARLASTISLVKTKRSFDELENGCGGDSANNNKENPDQPNSRHIVTTTAATAPVKRRRMLTYDPNFIEMVQSTTFETPTTPGKAAIFVPETPVKPTRTPLGVHDTNKGEGTTATANTAHYQSMPVFNFNAHFMTPTKETTAAGGQQQVTDANRTPVKGNYEKTFIPETPPKTVQKNLVFASGKKAVPQAPQKENISTKNTATTTPHIQNFTTPKAYTFKRSVQMKKSLAPELSNMPGTAATNSHRLQPSLSNIIPTSESASARPCECLDKPYICPPCMEKPELNVARAGTPGFRAPEILLRSTAQTAKIDIWSAGVIFASILSGRYPFFRCLDDMTCLAEVVAIFGTTRLKAAAKAVGKTLTVSTKRKALPLKDLCIRLRESLEANHPDVLQGFTAPDSAYDLLSRLLDPNPGTRLSAKDALEHEFFKADLTAATSTSTAAEDF